MFALLSLAVLGLLPAGVMLLLSGVRLMTAAVQRADETGMQRVLMTLTRPPLVAFLVGLVGTTVMQSSGALSSLLVELVSVQVLPLRAAIFMLLGANVGSTVVVQLLALHLTDYALELVGMGAIVALVTRRTAFHRLGQGLLAFGLVVLGLALLQMGSRPLATSPVTIAVLGALGKTP